MKVFFIKPLILTMMSAFSFPSLFAQKNKIRDSTYKIIIDSIEVDVKSNSKTISTINRFTKSGTVLDILFVRQSDSVNFVTVYQKSPYKHLNDMYCTWTFKIINDTISNGEYRTTVLPCISYPLDTNYLGMWGYNSYINNAPFLKSYILKLLFILKTSANKTLGKSAA